VTDSIFATTLMILALAGSGFAIQSTMRLRTEETAGRAEPLLAAALSRPRWAASHLTLALGGSVVMLVAAGLGVGVAYGVTTLL
jgi:ABC-2 type transport system permease protein